MKPTYFFRTQANAFIYQEIIYKVHDYDFILEESTYIMHIYIRHLRTRWWGRYSGAHMDNWLSPLNFSGEAVCENIWENAEIFRSPCRKTAQPKVSKFLWQPVCVCHRKQHKWIVKYGKFSISQCNLFILSLEIMSLFQPHSPSAGERSYTIAFHWDGRL